MSKLGNVFSQPSRYISKVCWNSIRPYARRLFLEELAKRIGRDYSEITRYELLDEASVHNLVEPIVSQHSPEDVDENHVGEGNEDQAKNIRLVTDGKREVPAAASMSKTPNMVDQHRIPFALQTPMVYRYHRRIITNLRPVAKNAYHPRPTSNSMNVANFGWDSLALENLIDGTSRALRSRAVGGGGCCGAQQEPQMRACFLEESNRRRMSTLRNLLCPTKL
ncbi:hypothetical protein MMC13_002774 [Lambiella insularis]|nr:hypothetical protein [Lambiella insularis]